MLRTSLSGERTLALHNPSFLLACVKFVFLSNYYQQLRQSLVDLLYVPDTACQSDKQAACLSERLT